MKESGPSTVLAVGWVQRDYKFMDRVSLQQDTSERSWVIAAVRGTHRTAGCTAGGRRWRVRTRFTWLLLNSPRFLVCL